MRSEVPVRSRFELRIARIPARLPAAAVAVAAAATCAVAPVPAGACTAFCLADQGIVAKNYDWSLGDGRLLVNKRGVRKFFSLTGEPERGAWTARYGSVTFNQYGQDLPQGGMNEAGLVVEILWLDDTVYPEPDDRAELGACQWIQYQLDTAATVAEVVESLKEVRVRSSAKVHWFVADRQGNAAAMEYLDGKPVVHTGDTLPAAVLTNHPYERSLRYLERHEGAGELPSTRDSLDRFVRAAVGLREILGAGEGDAKGEGGAAGSGEVSQSAPVSPVERAFELLGRVDQGLATKWSIVYEPAAARIRFRTLDLPGTRELSLEQLDFDCASPVRSLDLTAEVSGNVARQLADWTPEDNRDLVAESYRNTPMFQGTPREAIQRVAAYPATSSCVGLDLETAKSTTSGR